MGSVFELGPLARRAFSLAYLLALAAAVTYGQLAPDHVFGFQMFNESSSIKIDLFREVERGGRVELERIVDGEWDAPDAGGTRRHFSWGDRVRKSPLNRLQGFVHAPYGLDAQLYRLERALQDVARHVPEDHETRAFVAEVETRKNGRDSGRVRLRAARQ
jgi:hypothetical protein